MPKPRPALAALGLIAACAACCALPLMAGGIALGGLAAWLEFGALSAIAVVALGALLLRRRRRAAPACVVDSQAQGTCSAGCDCR